MSREMITRFFDMLWEMYSRASSGKFLRVNSRYPESFRFLGLWWWLWWWPWWWLWWPWCALDSAGSWKGGWLTGRMDFWSSAGQPPRPMSRCSKIRTQNLRSMFCFLLNHKQRGGRGQRAPLNLVRGTVVRFPPHVMTPGKVTTYCITPPLGATSLLGFFLWQRTSLDLIAIFIISNIQMFKPI